MEDVSVTPCAQATCLPRSHREAQPGRTAPGNGRPRRVRLKAWGTSHSSYDKAVNTPPSPPLLCREQGLEERTC